MTIVQRTTVDIAIASGSTVLFAVETPLNPRWIPLSSERFQRRAPSFTSRSRTSSGFVMK